MPLFLFKQQDRKSGFVQVVPSVFVPDIELAIQDFVAKWQDRDESLNFAQRCAIQTQFSMFTLFSLPGKWNDPSRKLHLHSKEWIQNNEKVLNHLPGAGMIQIWSRTSSGH